MFEELLCEEIKISVPWGYVAGKWWGPKNIQPVLVTHGWQDNCGSFDRLIPLLPRELSYLAIDLPGHGLSSQFPKGMYYFDTDMVMLIKRIMQHFHWTRISLMGPSLGAMHDFIYTMLYPDTVDFLVCLDAIKPYIAPTQIALGNIRSNCNVFLKYDYLNSLKKEPPALHQEELADKLCEASLGSVALESCFYLLRRNVVRSKHDPQKFYFNVDPRWKIRSIGYWVQEHLEEGTKKIECPVLVLAMTGAPFHNPESSYRSIFGILRENIKDRFELHHVKGTHHAHLNEPYRVAGIVSAFIRKYNVRKDIHKMQSSL